MDPISQGVLGATATQVFGPVSRHKGLATAGLAGALSGMAADLDVFFFSSEDPLLFLVYHRHFTHSLVFIPVGALIVSWVLQHFYFRNKLRFREVYLSCLVGYATHGLLDACTTYGTSLLWPFSDERIAWNIVSVVDPLMTVPAVVLVVLAGRRRSRRYAILALAWILLYLSAGAVQHSRAEAAARALADSRGHSTERLEVKPGFANLLLWKSVYLHQDYYYVDGIRAGLAVTSFGGDCIADFDRQQHMPWVNPGSQQATDIERFRVFSNGYLSPWGDEQTSIADIRYSAFPHEIDPIWGIELDPEKGPSEHVDYWTNRPATGIDSLNLLADLLLGRQPSDFRRIGCKSENPQ